MKKIVQLLSVSAAMFLMFSCDTLQSLPTNTTGGVFSLNGSWRLAGTTDAKSMLGSVISVTPVVGNASIKTVKNNTYCMKQNDEIWNTIKSNGAGGFSLNSLISACNGTTIYKAATVSVVNNDKVTLNTQTAANAELVQTWVRVTE